MTSRADRLPRVHLETPAESHAEQFVAAVRRSRELHGRWVSPPDTIAGFCAYVSSLRSPREAGYLVTTGQGELAGVVNLNEIVMGAFKSAYLGYYALHPCQGRGYMSAGLRSVIRKAFRDHGLHRLEANIQPRNTASARLVRRQGFRLEGLSPRYLKIAGCWRDHERWAITREDLRGNPV